ncbi:hypothetical protein [Acinetobacter baumannii]|uniref:hypothetical protein n=1 Tax=Acinetobacter baumannii TaxID=470 RepID=UPI000DF4B2C7|nr:hypothetical protein [Acinetobacter baumannii]RCT89683.1 hypothetical protein DVA68_15910 [Acinetobacter baumannii]
MKKPVFLDELSLIYHGLNHGEALKELDKKFSFNVVLDKIKNDKNLVVINVLNSFREQALEYSNINELQYGYGYWMGFLKSSQENLIVTKEEFVELDRIGECCYAAAVARLNHQAKLKNADYKE